MLSNASKTHETTQHEQYTSKQTINHDKVTQDRDQIIKNYLESEIPNAKSYFCRYFIRGHCLFSAKECKFAHGVEDFVFNKAIHLDQKAAMPLFKGGKNEKLSKGDENRDSLNEEEEKESKSAIDNNTQSLGLKIEQKPLGLEKSYIVIYNYQLVQKEKGKIEAVYTQEEINKNENGPILAALRRSMLKEVALGVYDLLFRELQTNALKISLVEAFFTNIGWDVLQPIVTDNQYAFEQNHPSGTYVVRIPKQSELFEIIEDNIISLIASFKLFENLPISPSKLKNLYYKEITAKKPFEPTLLVLQKRTNLSFDEFLQHLQQSERFKTKLAAAIEQENPALEDIIVFETASNERKQFCEKISRLIKEYIDASPLGLAKLSILEKNFVKECKNEIKRYNNNAVYIKKLIKYAALSHKMLFIQLLSDTYLLSLHKLKNISLQELDEVYKTTHHNCKESNSLMGPEYKYPPFKPYQPKIGDQLIPTDPYPQELLDKEIDMNKIVLVDNLEKLDHARTLLLDSKVVGVDLEGNLEKDGMVELVQCSFGGKIFVFDIYFLRDEAQNLQNEKAQATYNQTLKFLQDMMESPAICKIFHDGRKDSLGLHSCIQSCLLNTFDVSAHHSLISQLEVYSKYHKILGLDELKLSISTQEIKNNEQLSDEKCEEILRNLEIAARPPGLNDVLENYKASHGINGLKTIMKERFWNLSRGYFLQRPIDKEFLIYSARDVEDLEEVRNKMMKRLEVVLKNVCNGPSYEILTLLTTYVSHLYTNEGCIEFAECQ